MRLERADLGLGLSIYTGSQLASTLSLGIVTDLSEADLTGADLTGATLSGTVRPLGGNADLSRVDLTDANLSNADLPEEFDSDR